MGFASLRAHLMLTKSQLNGSMLGRDTVDMSPMVGAMGWPRRA